MCLIGAVPWIRGALIVVSQILGGIAAAAVVSALFPGEMGVRTSLGGGTSIVRGLFIEMFLTAELVFTIFMLAAEKHKGTFIAPIGIGLALFIAELTGKFHVFCAVSATHGLIFVYRCLLHWRLPQPSPLIRSRCCGSYIQRLPLDLLGWSWPWRYRCCRFLQVGQDARVRDRQPWCRYDCKGDRGTYGGAGREEKLFTSEYQRQCDRARRCTVHYPSWHHRRCPQQQSSEP